MLFHCLLWTSKVIGLVLVEHRYMNKMLCFFFLFSLIPISVHAWPPSPSNSSYPFPYMPLLYASHAYHTSFLKKHHVSFMPQASTTIFSPTTIFLSPSYPLHLGCFTCCPVHAHHVHYHSFLPFLQATPLNHFLYFLTSISHIPQAFYPLLKSQKTHFLSLKPLYTFSGRVRVAGL